MRASTLAIVLAALWLGACGALDDTSPRYAGIRIRTNVEDAEIFVDGQEVSPVFNGALLLEPGDHTVELKQGERVLVTHRVNVRAGETGPELDVFHPTARIFTNVAEAHLFVDGIDEGPIAHGQTITLAPGAHTFEARVGGRAAATTTATLPRVATDPIEVELYPPAPPEPMPTNRLCLLAYSCCSSVRHLDPDHDCNSAEIALRALLVHDCRAAFEQSRARMQGLAREGGFAVHTACEVPDGYALP